ncbi:MAG: type II secretion system minor pseudopilin GspK [Nitrospirae bacterium]|nr:type II secretion system minor pseudopilin GspK [Nitrospirota bacterium]
MKQTGARGRGQGAREKSNNASDQKGSALIITLLLITVLTGLVVNFVYEVYIDSSSLSNWGNAQKASLIAKSGQVIGTEFIREIKKETYTYIREVELPVTQDFGPGVSLSIVIEDENSRFNINSLIRDDGLTENTEAIASLKNMLEYLNINTNLALSIADWIDIDSEPRLHNSEDLAKNDFLWSIDELRLIEGVTKDVFDKMSPYITAYKDSSTAIPQININTAEIPVLMGIHSGISEITAKNIIEHRKVAPFEQEGSIGDVPGMQGLAIYDRIDVKPTIFKVTSTATVNEITRIIESVIDSNSKIQFWREG